MNKIIIIGLLVLVFLITGYLVFFTTSAPRYVFLITLDTARADYFDFVPGNDKTPCLAQLASQGIRFPQAYSLIPITLPSHYNMFYSMPPHLTRIYNNGQKEEVKQTGLATLLKQAGYHTSAVVSLGILKAEYGLNKNFDDYLDEFPAGRWFKTAGEVNREIIPLIKKRKGQKSFFWIHYSDPHEPYSPPEYQGRIEVMLNGRLVAADDCTKQPLLKVQLPLEPGKNVLSFICRIPEGFENRGATFIYRYFELTHIQPSGPVRAIFPSYWQKWQEKGDHIDFQSERNTQIILFNKGNRVSEVSLSFVLNILFKFTTVTRRLYQEEIVYMDSQLQELINFLQTNQMIDESLFVIIGDHGEGLGEVNNHFGHIHHLNSLYCHVPLVIFGRGIDKGKVNSQVVSTLEVTPTILKAIHTPVPEFMKGHSLTEPFVSSELFLETYSPEAFYDCFSIVDFPHQIVYFPQRDGHKIEFYNLEKDALAVNNLYLDSSVERTKKKLLAKIIKISQTMLKMKGKISAYSKETMQMLKTLGYL